jgi:O-antigen/teichoic acid export membrane protein
MAKDEAEQQSVVDTCFWSQTLLIAILASITIPLAGSLSFIFFGSNQYSLYLTIVAITGLLSAFGSFIFSFMRAKRKPIFFVIAQIIKVILLTLTNVYFVAVLHWSFVGIIVGNLIVFSVITIMVLIWFARFISFSFSPIYFKKIIVFVSPIYLVNVFFFLLNLSDRFFLNHFLTPAEVGIYSFGNKIGSIVMIGVITPFSTAVVPYALSIAKEDHFKKTFAKIIKYFLLILIYLSICIFYFSREIVFVVSNASYSNASGIIGPILLSSIFYGLYYNLSIAIDIVEKTYLATIVVISGAILSIGINYTTIPLLGMYGSALASCLSNGTLFIMMYYFCQKYFPIHYEKTAFFKLLGIIIFYVTSYYWLSMIGVQSGIVVLSKMVLCILFPVILFITKVFDGKEREYIKKYFRVMI